MKVLGIISSLSEASSRVRILQYKEPFKKDKVILTPVYFSPMRYADPAPWAYRLNKLSGINPWRFLQIHKTLSRLPLLLQHYKYDIVWQNRLIIPHQFFFEKKISTQIVFDFDDAIWLRDGRTQVTGAITKAAIVFAGNEYLADFAAKYNRNTFIIPSTIDTEKNFPLHRQSGYFTIGWIGTVTNFKFLDIIKPAVEKFLSLHADARFMVVSSEQPSQFKFENKNMIFQFWNAEDENKLINEFTIGLMPLSENDFTKGKCSYKMLQYMACGKPVVVSPVGMNNKILSEDTVGLSATTTEEWFNAFEILKNEQSFYNTCAENGRRLVENNYSLKKIAPVILGHFKKLTGNPKTDKK